LQHPIEHGIVTNWDDLEKILHHAFYSELLVSPEEHAILFLEHMYGPKANREKITELMFETFNVPAFYTLLQPAASLYATGKTSGLVVESGAGLTSVVPIVDGYALPHAIDRLYFAGQEISEYLAKLLAERGYSLSTSAELDLLNSIKERFCFVSTDYDQDMGTASSSSALDVAYELPDGKSISLGSERFQSTEAMFRPSLLQLEYIGVHESAYQSIMKCDVDVRKDLFSHVVLSGGNTMFGGMAERVRKELSTLAPPSMNVHVVAKPERVYGAWIGGSMFAGLSGFQRMCISKDEYDQFGASIVHRKCF
jgi:actin-related protein